MPPRAYLGDVDYRPSPPPDPPVIGGEYDVVSLRIDWALASITAFVLTLPFNYTRAWIWPDWIGRTVGGLSAVGFVGGLLGLRRPSRRGLAKVGAVLNGMVCVFLVLLEAICTWY